MIADWAAPWGFVILHLEISRKLRMHMDLKQNHCEMNHLEFPTHAAFIQLITKSHTPW